VSFELLSNSLTFLECPKPAKAQGETASLDRPKGEGNLAAGRQHLRMVYQSATRVFIEQGFERDPKEAEGQTAQGERCMRCNF